MTTPGLPDPECSFGYPLGQLRKLLGEEGYGQFLQWARNGRVRFGVCEQRCDPHGPVVYPADLHRWMQEAAV